MFFKNIQKLKNQANNIINEQFMNTIFHTLTYYNKVIIQFIFLSYVKNDLIKIGESILDYIEFLIKFKFKTPLNERNFLKIYNLNNSQYKTKQSIKKNIFQKIINWFNLFEDYLSYIKDNSSLDDNNKFCLYCKNYIDALYYFIRSSKTNCIIYDGLIKKKSLKHIYKILIILEKNYKELMLLNCDVEIKMNEYQKYKNKNTKRKQKTGRKSSSKIDQGKIISEKTFGNEIENIKKDIIQDIEEFNIKKEKDILILIDFNIYKENQDENIFNKLYKLDAFIEYTMIILKDYLSTSDRFCAFCYFNNYKIICPLMDVNKIDFNSFYEDLNNAKNIIYEEKKKVIERKKSLIELEDDFLNFELNSNMRESSNEDSSGENNIEENNDNKLKGLIEAINYINNYSRIKEGIKNEKYFILFTDIFNINLEFVKIRKYFNNLKEDKKVIFLLVGKNYKNEIDNNINNDIEKLIINKFGSKSEAIEFENMKKIKTILSKNKVIKDEIIHPNEIYK